MRSKSFTLPFSMMPSARRFVSAPAALRVRRRNAVSFQSIYDEHAPTVLRVLRRLGIRDADLNDAAQDVFLVVHRNLEDFEGRSTEKTWLIGICVRTAAGYRNKAHAKRETDLSEAPDRFDAGDGPFQTVAVSQARAQLEHILDTLDEHKRVAFVLFELEGWSVKDIAESLGCPLQTVYSRLQKAREQVDAAVRNLPATPLSGKSR